MKQVKKQAGKIGLALGANLARSLVYIGVLRAIEEHGILIDYVGGISLGALIGSFWCSGFSSVEIQEMLKKERLRRYFNVRSLHKGLLSSDRIQKRLRHIYPHNSYQQLSPKFACSTTDYNTGLERVFTEGDLAQTVTASMCMPALMSPVKIGSDYYGDGYFKNFFPIDTVRNMGANRVIIPTIHNYRVERMESYNAFTALMRGLYIRDHTKKGRELKLESHSSDVIIEIDAHDIHLTSLKNLDFAIERGYQTAYAVLKEQW